MEVPALLYDLNSAYGLDLPETATIDMLETILAARINTLIMDDFNRLVQLLYRIDVDESAIRALVRQNPASDAGVLIANLLLERLAKKEQTRREFKGSGYAGNQTTSEEEKW